MWNGCVLCCPAWRLIRKGGIASGRDPVLHGAANKVNSYFSCSPALKRSVYVTTVVAALPCSWWGSVIRPGGWSTQSQCGPSGWSRDETRLSCTFDLSMLQKQLLCHGLIEVFCSSLIANEELNKSLFLVEIHAWIPHDLLTSLMLLAVTWKWTVLFTPEAVLKVLDYTVNYYQLSMSNPCLCHVIQLKALRELYFTCATVFFVFSLPSYMKSFTT